MRDFRVAVIIAMILQGTLISLNVIMPLYIQNTMGYPPLVTGLAMMPGALLGGAASIVAGRLFDRIGVRKCVVPGIIFVFVGTTSLLLLDLDAGILFIALIYTIFPLCGSALYPDSYEHMGNLIPLTTRYTARQRSYQYP